MAKWTYVGPQYVKGVQVQDGTLIFPESLTDDAQIDDLIFRYPELVPYWRLSSTITNTGVGITGTGDKHYLHTQGTPQMVWTVVHNLGKHPSIMITDSAGTQVFGECHQLSLTTLELNFSLAFAGTCYCN
jgi:hypothetical protein